MKIIATQKQELKCCTWLPPKNISVQTKGMLDMVLKNASPATLASVLDGVNVQCPTCGASHTYSQLEILK